MTFLSDITMNQHAAADNDLLVHQDGAVVTITFNRPQARNAFTLLMYERLADIVRSLEERSGVRAVVFQGAGGKAFASGTDIAEFIPFSTPEHALGYERRLEEILVMIENIRVPTIASVAGACTGGGLMIAAVCDLRVAAANAVFGIPVARTLGNCLSMSNLVRLERLIGAGRVNTMMLSAQLMRASEALAAGFVTSVAADAEALASATTELASAIAAQAPITMRVTRDAMRLLGRSGGAVDPAAEKSFILQAYQSEDFAEGVRAFLAKRIPAWRGR